MKKLDQFILKSFVGPFFAILVIVVFILMLQFLWVYIDELVGKGLSFKVIVEFMFWGSCTTLPLCLPLATLLGSVMTIGQMAENNELMAIKSAGISLTRVMLPIFVASLLVSVAAFFVGNNLVPKAYNEIYTLRDDIGRTKNEIKIPAGTFYDGIDGYVLRVSEQDGKGMMHDVMVYDHTNNKGNTSLSLADSAVIKMSRNKDYLIFTLYDGISYMETNTRQYGKSSFELQHIDFEKQDLVIPLENYSFEKSDSSRYGDQAKAMKLAQLTHRHDSLSALFDAARDNKYKDIRRTGPFILRDELDTAKLAKRPRTEFFSDPTYMQWTRRDDKERAYSRAIDEARRASGEIRNYETDTHEYNFHLKRTDIELFKKFAQAIACLMLFFIGAPLGALIKKGGLGTGVIVAVLFFVLYWVVDISGTKLARDGSVAASVGTMISAVILAPIGFFLTNRAIHDVTFFDPEVLKAGWRKISSIVGRFFRPKRIVFMGTPEFAVASLDALVKKRYKVVAVVTAPDKPAGRGLKLHESAVKQYAAAHGIPVLQPLRLKDPEFLSQLSSFKPDLFVVVAFRMLPEEVWKMPRYGTFNLHASLLPQYRGAAPINWAVINGEKISGVTTFMLDKDIDTGGILLRQECRITPEDTAGTLHDTLMPLGAQLVVESVEGLFQRNIETRVQRSFIQGSEVLQPAPKLTKENTRIDWTRPTRDIHNLVRGLSPYPSAWTTLVSADGTATECKIFAGAVPEPGLLPESAAAAPCGTVRSDGRTYLAIAGGNGWYSVTELQLAGKKRMSVADFLRGFRNPESFKAV